MIRTLVKPALAALMLFAAAASHAWPDKPVTVVVPFPAGSSVDVLARDFGQALAAVIKQPVVFDNRSGAEGVIGGSFVLSAPADGHTLLFTSSSLSVLDPLMKKGLPYDFHKSFTPVCSTARSNIVMNITGANSMKSVAEVIAAAKASPGKLTFAYTSATTRLAAELFQQTAGVKLRGVPYRSSVTGLTEMGGGLVDLFFIDAVTAAPFYQSGRARALLTSGPDRLKLLPDVPSATEAGVPGYRIYPWYAVYASSKVPADLLAQIRSVAGKSLAAPEVAANTEKRGNIQFALCGDELVKFQTEDVELWRRVINTAGIEPQ